MRRIISVVVVAGTLFTLSGCASTPTTFAGCAATGNAALVSATGGHDADPLASFPTPLVATTPELAVAAKGTGAAVASSDVVEATVSVYAGATGGALQTPTGALTKATVRSPVNGIFPFTSGLACATVGSRVIAVGTASQLFGTNALGLKAATTLVVVTDIDAAYPGRATGADQLPQAGLPSVVLAPDGEPGFTFGNQTAPAGLKIAALKIGNGAKVAQGDTVIVNYTGVLWGAKTTFDSSWTKFTPASFVAASLVDNPNGLVPGLAKAIIGATVGSQILVSIPPSEGYPAGTAPATVPAGSTMVFVVDILKASK